MAAALAHMRWASARWALLALAGGMLVIAAGVVAYRWWLDLPDDTPITWGGRLVPEPQQPLREWYAILIHHSASTRGDVAAIDTWHRKRGWDGIGYHFVIGNGYGMRVGAVAPTFRWLAQREGAHAGVRTWNEAGIGICMIGDANNAPPLVWQMERTAQLCAELIRHCPHLSPERIIGHRDVPGKATDCPGRYCDIPALRARVRRILNLPPSTTAAADFPIVGSSTTGVRVLPADAGDGDTGRMLRSSP